MGGRLKVLTQVCRRYPVQTRLKDKHNQRPNPISISQVKMGLGLMTKFNLVKATITETQ